MEGTPAAAGGNNPENNELEPPNKKARANPTNDTPTHSPTPIEGGSNTLSENMLKKNDEIESSNEKGEKNNNAPPASSPLMEIDETEIDIEAQKEFEEVYEWIFINVDILKVKPVEHVIRNTRKNDGTVTYFIGQFKLGKYVKGAIRVGLVGLNKEQNQIVHDALSGRETAYNKDFKDYLMEKHPEAYEIIKNHIVYYCDGMHRGSAIVTIKEENVYVENLEFPCVRLLMRKDREPMSVMDIRKVGSDLNQFASAVVRMTRLDNLQNTLAMIHDIRGLSPDELRIEEKKLEGSPKILKAWKRFVSKSHPAKDVTDLMKIAAYTKVIDASTPSIASNYCTAALGIYRIAEGNPETSMELIEFLKGRTNLELIGAKAFWKPKSVVFQK